MRQKEVKRAEEEGKEYNKWKKERRKRKGADMIFQKHKGSTKNFKNMRVIYGISKT